MERLTEWNDEQTRHAYYLRCLKDTCYGSGCKINDCQFETEVCDRLAAYEDIGLTPEEIKAPFTEDTMINLAAQALGVEADRLRELAEADKDGRVVVLPCKVGDTVYFRTYDCNGKVDLGIQPHKVTAIVGNAIVRGEYTDVGLSQGQYGVSWFLTREEADAALEAMKDE